MPSWPINNKIFAWCCSGRK